MTAITISALSPRLSVVDGHATTTSLQVAELFGKLHKNVLQSIDGLECSPEFHGLNFQPMSTEVVIGNGAVRSSPAYRLTKDGFVFLAMGFTGKEAARFKEAYITAFNDMERQLRTQDPTLGLRAADMLAKTAKALRDSGVPKQQALAQALDEVHRQTGVRMLPDYTPEKAKAQRHTEQIVKYVRNAKRYAGDKRFGKQCAQGIMPHSKLLKLVAAPASEFAALVLQAMREDLIERVPFGATGTAYTLTRQ